MALTTSHFPDFWSGLNFWLWVGFNCRTLAWYFGSRPWKWENGLLSAEKSLFKLKFDLGDVRWLKVSSQNVHSAGLATYRNCLIFGYSPTIGSFPVDKIPVFPLNFRFWWGTKRLNYWWRIYRRRKTNCQIIEKISRQSKERSWNRTWISNFALQLCQIQLVNL